LVTASLREGAERQGAKGLPKVRRGGGGDRRKPHARRMPAESRPERTMSGAPGARPSHSTRACRCRIEAWASTTDYEWPVRARAPKKTFILSDTKGLE